jgi:hypothetical protein
MIIPATPYTTQKAIQTKAIFTPHMQRPLLPKQTNKQTNKKKNPIKPQ